MWYFARPCLDITEIVLGIRTRDQATPVFMEEGRVSDDDPGSYKYRKKMIDFVRLLERVCVRSQTR